MTQNKRKFTPEQREAQLKRQRNWYLANRHKRQRKYQPEFDFVKQENTKTRVPFFEILNVLQKDKRHKLWYKSVKDWNYNDWVEFDKLKKEIL